MKIEIVTRNLLAGGAERVIAQLLSFWSKKGITCKLILLEKAEKFYNIPQNIVVEEIAEHHKNKIINKYIKYREVRKKTIEYMPDVVLSMPEEIGIYTIVSLLASGIPVVVSERNDPWKMPYKRSTRILRLLAYPFLSGLIFQTPNAALYFPPFIRKKGVVLPNPIDKGRFENVTKNFTKEKSHIVISAGRLEKQKNFCLLIDAFAKLTKKHPDYKLIIYGEGKERDNLEKYIAINNMAEHILLPGKTKDLLQKMADADLFVLSSDYEGVPNVLIEALAVGTPCISTDCSPGGAATLIHDGENGFLTKVGDSMDLYKKMEILLLDDRLSIAFSEKGRLIREELDIDAVGVQWLAYLQRIVEKNDGRR